MKGIYSILGILVLCVSCTKQASLPLNSRFNVTSRLNDSLWYGTGVAVRSRLPEQDITQVRNFNLIVNTDIDYPYMDPGRRPNTENGCTDPECTKTQLLIIYDIPLKKGRHRISLYDRKTRSQNNYARHCIVGNSSGLLNQYIYTGSKPGYIKITRYDKATGVLEGRFSITFNQDTIVDPLPLRNIMANTSKFSNGLFRIKIKDVILK